MAQATDDRWSKKVLSQMLTGRRSRWVLAELGRRGWDKRIKSSVTVDGVICHMAVEVLVVFLRGVH